jgi:PAS domain S-box-containing protein
MLSKKSSFLPCTNRPEERMSKGAILAPSERGPFTVDARMTPLVPKKSIVAKTGQLFEELSDLLFSALEFIGATAGWIGLQDAGGGLTYPVRGGSFSEAWLPWQQGHGGVWGFAVSGEPALLNEVQPWSKLVHPPLRNLLSCPLIQNDHIVGHVALANKAHGFTAQDSVVLQGLAHHMARLLGRQAPAASGAIELPAPWRRILDRADEAILVLDEAGVLIYANPPWLDWTGFPAEELIGRTAPFPFWISQQDLVQALSMSSAIPANLLPFRHRDHSLFWCRLETVSEHWNDHVLTVAFLRTKTPFSAPAAEAEPSDATIAVERPTNFHSPTPEWLPLLLDLDNGIEGWCAVWEERTGLSANDVEGSRCELVLDWLFPQQPDRDHVADCFQNPRSKSCQLVLEVAAVSGSRPMLCTFLPLPARAANVMSRRWLLLIGEQKPAANPHPADGSLPHDPSSTVTVPQVHKDEPEA